MAEDGADDVFQYDGMFKENALRFRKTKTVKMMMAIDPDTRPDHPVDTPDAQGPANDDFAAIEPDGEEVVHLGNQPSAAEAGELISDGHAPPAGWRRDDFPPQGPVRRTVWAPPWSLRPPHQSQKKDTCREQ